MARVTKLDSRRRAVFPDRFAPGDLFVEELVEGDRIVFRLVEPADVPVVGLKDVDGYLMVDAPLDLDRIRQAVRDDRDSR